VVLARNERKNVAWTVSSRWLRRSNRHRFTSYLSDRVNRPTLTGWAMYRGRKAALECCPPPSEPDGRISRIRLSDWQFYPHGD